MSPVRSRHPPLFSSHSTAYQASVRGGAGAAVSYLLAVAVRGFYGAHRRVATLAAARAQPWRPGWRCAGPRVDRISSPSPFVGSTALIAAHLLRQQHPPRPGGQDGGAQVRPRVHPAHFRRLHQGVEHRRDLSPCLALRPEMMPTSGHDAPFILPMSGRALLSTTLGTPGAACGCRWSRSSRVATLSSFTFEALPIRSASFRRGS